MTFKEMCKYLSEHHDQQGVIVFKKDLLDRKDYQTEAQRSWVVEGRSNLFYKGLSSKSLFGHNLADGVEAGGLRLDYWIQNYKIDHCYILE